MRALEIQRVQQERERAAAGERGVESGLVFTTKFGGRLDANNVRRDFRVALKGIEGIDPEQWVPRELRHSFVSLLSDAGVPIEDIPRLVGHAGTTVTELVYRHQIRPVVQVGAEVMDTLFDLPESRAVDAQLDARQAAVEGSEEAEGEGNGL